MTHSNGLDLDAPCRSLPADDAAHTPKTWSSVWQFGFGWNALRHEQRVTYCAICGKGITVTVDELPRGGS